MSPEQMKDSSQIEKRSDIYSLGATLYYAATSKSPDPSKISPEDIYELLQDPIFKALEENPQNRFKDAKEFQKALNKVLDMLQHFQHRKDADISS